MRPSSPVLSFIATSLRRRVFLSVIALAAALPARATLYTLTSSAGFSSLPSTLQAGDEVLIKDGTYANIIRTLKAAGTADHPVLVHAEHPGSVFFSGGIQFKIQGTWMVISGLIFDGDVAAGGPGYPSGLFRFDLNSADCTLRDCRFNNFDTGSDPVNGSNWIYIAGYRHTIEYCSFSNKIAPDPVIAVSPDEDAAFTAGTYTPGQDVPRHHRIRYCYFGERSNIGDNGYEIVRMSEGKFINFNLASTVEHCLFDKAIYRAGSGEPEIISNKSCHNIYRANTFVDCRGGIVLRAGDDCLVEGNYFFGEPGSDLATGIRVVGQRHLIRNNYLQDIDGTGLNAAICVMKGSGGWSDVTYSSGYESPNGARIYHNTIVNCTEAIALGVTTSDPSKSGTTAPTGVIVANNLIQSAADDGPTLTFNEANGFALSSVTFAGNQAYHATGNYGGTSSGALPATGFATGTPVSLALDGALGYYVPAPSSPARTAAVATSPATARDARGLLRPTTGADAGAYDHAGTGAELSRPLAASDVGPVFDGRTSAERAPRLLSFPADQSTYAGDAITLAIAVDSTLPAAIQWCKDDVPLPGATDATLSFPAIVAADAGVYTAEVTNAAGNITSFPATLTVASAAPVLTTFPTSQTSNLGDTVAFTVAADGVAPFTYAWTHDGSVIAGATDATLTLTNIQATDAGAYAVTVTNSAGSATSADAILTLPAAGQTFVVNESFADGNRSGDSPPDSLAWFCSSSASNVTMANSALTLATSNGGRHVVAHLPLQTLAIGDRITLRFTFSLAAPINDQSNGLRFGLFNRNGNAAYTADASNSAVTYTGYAAFANLAPSTADPASLRKRSGTAAASALITTSSSYTAVGSAGGPTQSFVAGTAYTAELTVQRTDTDAVALTSSYSGGTLAGYTLAETDSAIVNAFDTVAIAVASSSNIGAAGSITVTNVVVIRDAPAIVATAPALTSPPADTTIGVGGTVTLDVTATGTTPLTYQWAKDGADLAGATSASLVFSTAQLADAGSYTVTVTNSAGSVISAPAVLTVVSAPAIEPLADHVTTAPGSPLALTIALSGEPPFTFQWFKDGVAIAGATKATYTVPSASAADAGSYTVAVTNLGGTVTSSQIVVAIPTSYLSNLSVRAALNSSDTLIVGFVVASGAKSILVRAAGPALADYGVTNAADDPRITLFDANGLLEVSNDDWGAVLANLFSNLGAFPFANASKDAALLAILSGPHTAHVASTSAGIAVVEAYDANLPDPRRLSNLSARYHVGTGSDLLIAGFVVAGTGPRRVLVRAVGPTLTGYGVSAVLADPQFTVFDAAGQPLARNDDWDASLASTFAAVGAFDLDAASHDAALVVTLPAPGPYTVQVSGVGETTGEALVEVYDLP